MSDFVGSPEKIFKKMRWKKRLLYFIRNNSRSRYFYYHAFIGWVGHDNWNKVEPKIRNAWEEALSSFDKQYGVIKSLRWVTDKNVLLIPQPNITNAEKKDKSEEKDKEKNETKKQTLNDLINEIGGVVINLSEKKKKMSESERELFVALGELKIKNFSDDSLEKHEWEAIKKYMEPIETSKTSETSETSEKTENTDNNKTHPNKSDVIISVINC